jgi:hypothetical protein
MTNYLRPQSPRQILRNALEIYGKGFRVIFLTYFLPIFPFLLWREEMEAAGKTGLYLAAFFFQMIAGLFTFGAVTVAVSDMCIGNKPSVVRSYKKVFSTVTGKLLVTNVMQAICWGIGFIPFILIVMSVSGKNGPELLLMGIGLLTAIIFLIIAVLWLFFAPSIVVLEGKWAFSALQRSRVLARGYNWRNLGVLILVFIMLCVAWVILAAAFYLVFREHETAFQERIFLVVVQALSVPLFFIATVLLFYDLKVRKEDYNPTALMEDLMR